MRALLTGATGFVGSHLAERLRTGGADITALVRSPAKAAQLTRLGARLVRGDLADRAALAEAARDQDIVFHVAGAVSARDEQAFMVANRDGTAAVVEAAEAAGVQRFVHVSSMAAGGPSKPGQPRHGDEAPNPVTGYGRSKLAGEVAVRESQLRWTIIRPPMVYGPGDHEVLRLFRSARNLAGVTPVFGPGTQELSAVYGPDLADALFAAATTDATIGRVYYACHPEVFTQAEFSSEVARAVGKSPHILRIPSPLARTLLQITDLAASLTNTVTLLTADKAYEFFAPAWTGDPGPLMRDAGWVPRTGIAEGLASTARWYRETGWL